MTRVMWDYYKMEIRNVGVEYFLHNFITFLFLTDQALLLWRFSDVPFMKGFMLSWGIYEITFDYLLNFFRKKPVFTYFGDFTDKKNLSFIEEKIYQFLSWKVIMAVKVAFFALTVVYYAS